MKCKYAFVEKGRFYSLMLNAINNYMLYFLFQAQKDMELDELSTYYENSYEPKVLITYSDNPHSKTRIFGRELTRIIPNSLSRYRQRYFLMHLYSLSLLVCPLNETTNIKQQYFNTH